MRRLALVLTLAAMIALPVAGVHASPDGRNFWLLNNTGHTLKSFYVSPHESGYWGTDTLGRGTVARGWGVFITWTGRSSCVMDFKLVFDDGTAKIDDDGMNVCPLVAVIFTADTAYGIPLPQ